MLSKMVFTILSTRQQYLRNPPIARRNKEKIDRRRELRVNLVVLLAEGSLHTSSDDLVARRESLPQPSGSPYKHYSGQQSCGTWDVTALVRKVLAIANRLT